VPVYLLDERLAFPAPERAPEAGPLAVGGDLRPERLVLAYSLGIFPWYGPNEPIQWHSPDPRMVLLADELRVSRSLRRTLKKTGLRLTLDTAFRQVVEACAQTPRPGQAGTWITDEMKDAYSELHRRGLAHSAEAWNGGELAGGLYGVSLGGAFFGESMFAHVPEASKVAFAAFTEQLHRWDIDLIDCQVYTEHLARFGAEEWPRRDFLAALRTALEQPTRKGRWCFDGPEADGAS
jgi:leucyl/phenylalanyl-tRNA--protein transferase